MLIVMNGFAVLDNQLVVNQQLRGAPVIRAELQSVSMAAATPWESGAGIDSGRAGAWPVRHDVRP